MEMRQHHSLHMVLVALLSLVLVSTAMAFQGDSEEYLSSSNPRDTIELWDGPTSKLEIVQSATAEHSGMHSYYWQALEQALIKRERNRILQDSVGI